MRTPEEREGDLAAQMGACRVGERRLKELVAKYGHEKVDELSEGLLDYSERLMRAELRKMPAGRYEAEDFMDSDGVTDDAIRIAVAITFDPETGSAAIDFSGSSPQVGGSINAVYAITYSACFYVFRCLLADDAPATAGLMNAITSDSRLPEPSSMRVLPRRLLVGMWSAASVSSMCCCGRSQRLLRSVSPRRAMGR